MNTRAIFDEIEGRKERWRMIAGEKLGEDAIKVVEEDHVDYTTPSEKFGHSKEIMTKSATIERRFSISVVPIVHTLPWHHRQRTKIRRF